MIFTLQAKESLRAYFVSTTDLQYLMQTNYAFSKSIQSIKVLSCLTLLLFHKQISGNVCYTIHTQDMNLNDAF